MSTQTRAFQASGVSYRRFFEPAQNGILIDDAEKGTVAEVKPYLLELLEFLPQVLKQKGLDPGLLQEHRRQQEITELQAQENRAQT